MSSDRLEEVTLINDSSYLHLKENDSGFQYALFDKESRDKVCDGQFDWTELEDSPIGNPLVTARHYAFSDIGIEAEKVSRVSLDILESFMDEQMAWKVGKDHYMILQTCDDGWDYTLYDKKFKEIDGGQLDMPELSMQEARSEILKDFQLDKKDLVAVDYDEIVERAEMMEAQKHKEIYAEREANWDFREMIKYHCFVVHRLMRRYCIKKQIHNGGLRKNLFQKWNSSESSIYFFIKSNY